VGDVSGYHGWGYSDIWVVKISQVGNIEWQRCFGGTWWESGSDIQQTRDGGYIFVGSTNSPNDGDVQGIHTPYWADFWVVKLSESGSIQWQKCLGGAIQTLVTASTDK